MGNFNEPRELTWDERELKAMYELIQIDKKKLAEYKESWCRIPLGERGGEKALELQAKMARLDIHIIRMSRRFENTLQRTGCIWPLPVSKKDPSTIVGQYMCILLIIVIAGLILSGLLST